MPRPSLCRAGSDRRLCPAVAGARNPPFWAVTVTCRRDPLQHTEARGVLAGGHYNALSREPAFQEFADRRCAAGQAVSKPPIIQCADFLRVQHDLQPVWSREIGHDPTHSRAYADIMPQAGS